MRDVHPGSGLPREAFWLEYERYPYLLAKLAFFIVIAYGLYALVHTVQDVLTPVLVSMLLAYLLDPAIDAYEARGHSRTAGILWCLALGGGAIFAFSLFLWPTIAHLVDEITQGVPRVFDLLTVQALPWVEERAFPWIEGSTGLDLPDTLSSVVPDLGASLQGQLPGLVRRMTEAFASVWTQTGAIVASVLNLVLIPVLTFYFLRDFDRMRLAAVDYLPLHNREWLLERLVRVDEVVGAWFRGQVEVAVILAALYAVGLGLTFGVSGLGLVSGVAIGLLAGFLNVIPYFGFIIGIGLALLLALLDWQGWGPLVGVLATFGIVQGLEGYVITPRIVGEKVGLSPVVVIVTLLIGGSLLGLVGILLSLPIAGAIGVLLPDLIAWYKRSDVYTGQLFVREPPPDTTPPTEGKPPPE